MKVLSCHLKRDVSGGFLLSCRVRGRGGIGVQISHLFIVVILLSSIRLNMIR